MTNPVSKNDWSTVFGSVEQGAKGGRMALEAKVIDRKDLPAFAKDGWAHVRDVPSYNGDDRIVIQRKVGATKPRKGKTAHVDADPDGFLLRTPYDPDFVDELKTRVEWKARKWDGELKVWRVHKSEWRAIQDVLKKHYGEGNITYSDAADVKITECLEEDVDSPDLAAYFTLGVRSDAPECVLHAAYLAIEACYGPVADGLTQLRPDDVPDVDDARAAYAKICVHRGLLPRDAHLSVYQQMGQKPPPRR